MAIHSTSLGGGQFIPKERNQAAGSGVSILQILAKTMRPFPPKRVAPIRRAPRIVSRLLSSTLTRRETFLSPIRGCGPSEVPASNPRPDPVLCSNGESRVLQRPTGNRRTRWGVPRGPVTPVASQRRRAEPGKHAAGAEARACPEWAEPPRPPCKAAFSAKSTPDGPQWRLADPTIAPRDRRNGAHRR
jgi:hypothetical protein